MAFNILVERFYKFEIFSKNYCLSIYETMSFLELEIGYWIAARDKEMILKIFILRLSATFL